MQIANWCVARGESEPCPSPSCRLLCPARALVADAQALPFLAVKTYSSKKVVEPGIRAQAGKLGRDLDPGQELIALLVTFFEPFECLVFFAKRGVYQDHRVRGHVAIFHSAP